MKGTHCIVTSLDFARKKFTEVVVFTFFPKLPETSKLGSIQREAKTVINNKDEKVKNLQLLKNQSLKESVS